MAAAAASERMHNHVLRRAKKQSGQATVLQPHHWMLHRSAMKTPKNLTLHVPFWIHTSPIIFPSQGILAGK